MREREGERERQKDRESQEKWVAKFSMDHLGCAAHWFVIRSSTILFDLSNYFHSLDYYLITTRKAAGGPFSYRERERQRDRERGDCGCVQSLQ